MPYGLQTVGANKGDHVSVFMFGNDVLFVRAGSEQFDVMDQIWLGKLCPPSATVHYVIPGIWILYAKQPRHMKRVSRHRLCVKSRPPKTVTPAPSIVFLFPALYPSDIGKESAWILLNPTLRLSKPSMTSIRCFRDRPRRSRRQTTRQSPLRANSRAFTSSGRSVLAPAAWSEKIFLQPAFFNASC